MHGLWDTNSSVFVEHILLFCVLFCIVLYLDFSQTGLCLVISLDLSKQKDLLFGPYNLVWSNFHHAISAINILQLSGLFADKGTPWQRILRTGADHIQVCIASSSSLAESFNCKAWKAIHAINCVFTGVIDVQVFTSDHALKLEWVPDWVAIIGSGYIGLEFSDVYTALGSEVTFIEVNFFPLLD